ncbi:MAG: Gfo/Idh/MocA family oxidoreductase, partial [Candidatus Margulisiibacteriota bacterium]
MTMTLVEAKELIGLVENIGLPFVTAYTYTGFPMVMLARELVQQGVIGSPRKVAAAYDQGWLATRLEDEGQQQAVWRVDPEQAGSGGCIGDIGSHAEMFARFVTGLEISEVSARLFTFAEGRELDDDFAAFVRFSSGQIGTISATQIQIGAENDNSFTIAGDEGTLQWSMKDPFSLWHTGKNVPAAASVYRLGANYSYIPDIMKPYLRLPCGHYEAFLEALANLHRTIELQIRRKNSETDWDGNELPKPYPHPGVRDGAKGIAFIEAAYASSQYDGAWTTLAAVE